LTIFKPLPPLNSDRVPPELAGAMVSFIRLLDDRSEMLIGIDPRDHGRWKPLLASWRAAYPAARLEVVVVTSDPGIANPKIARQIRLAPSARGELWLWSDADIVAPVGFLNAIRAELAESGLRALTCPYVIRSVGTLSSLLDALFVNVEFYPGVLMLRRRGPVSFALGSASLFYAEDFRRRADWYKLGATLADDNSLGESLAPVLVSRTTVETLPHQTSLFRSLAHYLRWHKTVRWCEPLGYAGQIILLPALGWIIHAALHPGNPWAWAGLAGTLVLEAGLALWIHTAIGNRLLPLQHLCLPLWPLVRSAAWILSWLPVPVAWTGSKHRWWRLIRPLPDSL
jgi:glycosyl transferase family 21